MGKKSTYISVLSILAMLTFAISDVSSDIWHSVNVRDSHWDLYGIITIMSQWGTPLLISLWGILFLDTDMQYSTNIIYCKLLPQATIACGVWWVVSAVIHLQANFPNEIDVDTFLECMGVVLNDPYNVFLLQLFVIMFAFYPLLYTVAKNDKLLQYAVIISFVICMLFPVIASIPYVRVLSLFTDQINWNFLTSYGFYLLFGIWITRKQFAWHHRVVIYCMAMLGSVAMLSLTKIISAPLNDIDTRFVGMNSPFVPIQVLAVIVFSKQLFNRELKINQAKKVFCEITDNIYGYVCLYVIVSNLVNNYVPISTRAVFPLILFIFINIICSILRRLPFVSYLLCTFKIRGERI